MHGVRLELLERQARCLNLPLETVFVSDHGSNDEYQQRMAASLSAHTARGVTGCAFGDIFLEDLKRWREESLARIGLRGIFPLWKNDSRELIREFFALGFSTVICCVNDAWLDETFVGRTLDWSFIRDLPPNVDPCGENGEFHSFAFAGPIFKTAMRFKIGEKLYRPKQPADPTDSNAGYVCPPGGGPEATRGFWFCDLVPT